MSDFIKYLIYRIKNMSENWINRIILVIKVI
jgi:hypothetical protein